MTRPIAEALGIEEVISTQFEVDGRASSPGGWSARPASGQGKVHWAEDLGARRQLDLGESWFYTDSYTDLPMLERVGNRVVVNPDPRLRRAAKRRGWPVQDWRRQRRRPGTELARERLFRPLVHPGGAADPGSGARGGRRPRRRHHAPR